MNISKQLSYFLRHHPEKAGLTMDKNGWVPIGEVTKYFSISYSELKELVINNDKSRFAFSPDKLKIRANQGHSIEVDLELESIKPPIHLYHGTTKEAYELIKEQGIKKMNRQHVHLSHSTVTALMVAGRRRSESVILTVDSLKMAAHGIKFYKSDNGVYLTDFVDPKYIVI